MSALVRPELNSTDDRSFPSTKFTVFEGTQRREWARQLGIKMVHIDPHLNHTAAHLGGKWIAPKPGTDPALAQVRPRRNAHIGPRANGRADVKGVNGPQGEILLQVRSDVDEFIVDAQDLDSTTGKETILGFELRRVLLSERLSEALDPREPRCDDHSVQGRLRPIEPNRDGLSQMVWALDGEQDRIGVKVEPHQSRSARLSRNCASISQPSEYPGEGSGHT